MRKITYSLAFKLLVALFLVSCGSDEVVEEKPKEPARPSMNKQDSLAIVAFYHSMKCAEWVGFDWDLTDYETWGGVSGVLDKEKNEWRITKIETPWAPLFMPSGYSLPPELGNLTMLEDLRVWGDRRAVGGIPPELFNCPLRILKIVDVEGSHGGFSGTIPKEIGKVANTLEYLEIANTSISGEIPEEVGTLHNLKYRLMLDGNNLSGKVPLFLRDLPVRVVLIRNYFTEMDWRYFTEDIGYVPDLMDNHLHGEVPEEVWTSERWTKYYLCLYNQADGYGYDNKYFP